MNDQLLSEAKKYAADTGRTLTALLEDALRETLARRNKPEPRRRIKLKTVGGGGVQAGVDLDDSAALLDVMDRGG